MRLVPTDPSHTARTVEELLELLAGTLDESQKPDFERQAALIRTLLAPDAAFSARTFIADEVARALQH